LAFDFFGDRGDGITDLRDNPMQIVARNAKPPFQASYLAGVSHIDFIASGRGSSVAHVMQLRDDKPNRTRMLCSKSAPGSAIAQAGRWNIEMYRKHVATNAARLG
jgi:hypothetical protein